MKELVVLGFASRQLAEEARSCSAEVDPEGALNLDGVALAYRHYDQPNRHQPPGDEISSIMPPRRTTRASYCLQLLPVDLRVARGWPGMRVTDR
jgi:hypothetical protein